MFNPTGRFVRVLNFWLWDDAVSPALTTDELLHGLVGFTTSSEAAKRVGEMQLVHTFDDDTRLARDYLQGLRTSLRYEHLNKWLITALLRISYSGEVEDQLGRRLSLGLLPALKAYIDCLHYWGLAYGWAATQDNSGEPGLSLRYNNRVVSTVLRRDIRYIEGKPYRFIVGMRRQTWRFDVRRKQILISTRNLGPVRDESATEAN